MNMHHNNNTSTNNNNNNNNINQVEHNKGGIIQCNLCKKLLPTLVKLEEHLIEHTFNGCEERGFICYICSSVFTSVTGLHGHMHQEHGGNAKPYDCNLCNQKFFFRAELDNHMVDHENFTNVNESDRVKTPACDEGKAIVGTPTSNIKCEIKDNSSAEEENSPTVENENLKEDEEDEYIEVEHGEGVPKAELEERHKNDDDN